jgi:hypothetical protein
MLRNEKGPGIPEKSIERSFVRILKKQDREEALCGRTGMVATG